MPKFEIVSDFAIMYNNSNIILPKRATKHAAGYDLFCPAEITINPGEIVRIATNVKVKMSERQVLILAARSSFSNNGLYLANSIGIIDADFYGNKTNDGNISFTIGNRSDKPFTFNKEDKLGQGIFTTFLITDDDETGDTERAGGFGSTGR